MSNPRGLALAYSKSTTMIFWCGAWRLRSSLRSSLSSSGVSRSRFPYWVSLCEKTRLLLPSVFSQSRTNERYSLTCCSNSGRFSSARSSSVSLGESSGVTWSSPCSASVVDLRPGEGGPRKDEKPGSAASWSSSLSTSLASRVQRVMFSHTPSLSRVRRLRLLIDDRLRFLRCASDSLLPRWGSSIGLETSGVPNSLPNEPPWVEPPEDEVE